MLVSFLMPTYGRFPHEANLLSEACYWFTQQQSSQCELIILNDSPEQQLTCRVERVRVVNMRKRFESLGDKRNALLALARSPYVAVWDDDDIRLPNATTNILSKLGGDADYYWPAGRYFQNGASGDLVPDFNNCRHHACAFKKGMSCYQSAWGDEDQRFEEAIRTLSAMGKAKICFGPTHSIDHLDMVYRWGVSRNHISGNPDMKLSWHSRRTPAAGTWEIVPAKFRDYEKEVEELKAKIRKGG